MTLEEILVSKATKENYTIYLNLLKEIFEDGKYYPEYLYRTIPYLKHEKSYIKSRAFGLICSFSPYDTDMLIKQNIIALLSVFNDENGIYTRVNLDTLKKLILYSNDFDNIIFKTLKELVITQYKESLQGLIQKDISDIIALLENR